MGGLEASETSAFSPYTRRRLHIITEGDDSAQVALTRPRPRLVVPLVSPQEDRSDSCIYKKIRSKRKERSSSAGEIRSPNAEETTDSPARSSPVLIERLNDFQQILKRFQESSMVADKRAQHSLRYATNEVIQMSSPPTTPLRRSVEEWSPFKGQDSWSPTQSSSMEFATRSSLSSRDASGRSRARVYSTHNNVTLLPTRGTTRSMPSTSLLPYRLPTPSSSEQESSNSPLSHTDSLTETTEVISPSLYMAAPKPKRKTLPNRWVKESDVDDPTTFYLSPIESVAEDIRSIKSATIRQDISLNANSKADRRSPNPKSGMDRLGGSCRKVLLGVDANTFPNTMMRRSRSKDEQSSTGLSASSVRAPRPGSRSATHSIPIFMTKESVGNVSRNSSNGILSDKTTVDSPYELYRQYHQMSLSHVQTLSMVADRLANDMRRGEEPVSRNQLGQLEFSHFVITSPHPLLTKGKSLFYNALLPRPGNSDYLVTLMIASYSQYAPLMRRSGSQIFLLPGFLELEDLDGSVKKFLHDTGTPNLDGRHTKVIAMPRLSLCSFHTLAAHHLNERMNSGAHEQLVSFILLQLLTALKMLQSDGVELLSINFKEFLLAYRFAPDSQQEMLEFPRLIFLPETLGAEIESGGDELVGLCRYAMRALCTLLRYKMDGKPPPIQLRSRYSRALLACASLLQEDKSSSLTKAKNVLEVALWGGEPCHTDIKARIWLDMARAECVDALLRQLICEPGCRLGACEHYKIEFLLSATPRSIVESQAAILAVNI